MRNGTVRLQTWNLLQDLSNRQGQWSSIKNCLGSRKNRFANRCMTEAVWVRSTAERGEQTVLCKKPQVKPQHLPIYMDSMWNLCSKPLSLGSLVSCNVWLSETSDLASQTGDKKRGTQSGVWMSPRGWKERMHLEVLLLNPSEALGSSFSSVFCQERGWNGGLRERRRQDPVGKRGKGWMRLRVKKDEWNTTEWAPLGVGWPWSTNPRHCSLGKEMCWLSLIFPGEECHDLGTVRLSWIPYLSGPPGSHWHMVSIQIVLLQPERVSRYK